MDYEQKLLTLDKTQTICDNPAQLNCLPESFLEEHVFVQGKKKSDEDKVRENLRLYVKQITLAQEEERLRISRELHDTTVQSLIAVLHDSERFMEKNKTFNMTHTRFLLNLTEQIKGIIQEVRYLSSNLRPAILDDLGLLPSIEFITDKIRQNYGIEIRLGVKGKPYRFLPEVEVSIFRVIQEALQNIVRHAEATKVDVLVEFDKEDTRFIVRDNGKGIQTMPNSVDELPRAGKLGLAGMFERVELVRGAITLQSSPGNGTLITVSIPVKDNIVG